MQLVLLALHRREESVYAFEAPLSAQHDLARRFAHLAPRHIHGDPERAGLLLQIRKPRAVLRPVPWVDCSVSQAQTLVWNHEVQVVVHRIAETLTSRARAKGIVEAEQPRLRLLARSVATRAFVLA